MKNSRSFLATLGQACLLVALISPRSYTQQLSPEQQFFAAIRSGDSTKVAELLRQQPALSKATTSNGTTPVLYAVYAKHVEIAKSLIATGIELNIFEAAATGNIERVRQ